jgi:D-alanyl-D-alanine carboxypeptidase
MKQGRSDDSGPFGLAIVKLIYISLTALVLLAMPNTAAARSFAEVVMDLRDGTVYHTKSADKRLHPASLTKMMTLYLSFQALENGTITTNTRVRISRNASSQPPSKFGWRAGDQVEFRDLIRAAAIKSANDAAVAIAEALGGGSEAAFINKMNSTARQMGMNRTTFRNPHGLTHAEHLSTARDMAILARRLYQDFPDYFHLFSKISIRADGRTVYNSNRRFLSAMSGATGLKTGYTNAAGYNLAATAKRNDEHLVAIVLGGSSSGDRAGTAIRLLQLGFQKAPGNVRTIRPKALSPSGAVKVTLRPILRPTINDTIPDPEVLTESDPIVAGVIVAPQAPSRPTRYAMPLPPTRVALNVQQANQNRDYAIDIGGFYSKYDAQKALLQVALSDIEFLGYAKRDVRHTPTAWRGVFTNLTEYQATQICAARIQRNMDCSKFPDR